MGRLTASFALAGAVCSLALAGCGGGAASSPLDEALGYLPKDAPFAVAIETDLEGGQYRSLDRLVGKFPFGDQVKSSLKRSIEQDGDVDFERDVKPLLGNEFVVGAPDVRALTRGGNDKVVAALQAKDQGKLQDLVERQSAKEIGQKSGATLYEGQNGEPFAIKGDVLVVAGDRKLLEAALEQREDGDRLGEDAFNRALKGLPEDALARVYGDLEALIKDDPDARDARRVKWVGALRTLGLTASVEDDRIAVDFEVKTDPQGLSEADLPIASGEQSPAVVKRSGEIAFGVREPRQIFDFAQRAAQAANPSGFGQFEQAKRQIEQRLGVSIDDDLVGQLTKNAAVSVGVDGKFGLRAELKDPRAFERTLRKVADVLPRVAEDLGGGRVGLAKPKRGEDFYALAQPDGDSVVFGVVNDVLVVANDPERAGRLAAASPGQVSDAKGAVVVSADAGQVAQAILRRLGGLEGTLGGAVARPLGDLNGSASGDTEGISGRLTLGID
jgi:uncharacterized protein DUF3352